MVSQEQKKQKILIVILIALILSIALVLVWVFLGPKTVTKQPAEKEISKMAKEKSSGEEGGRIFPMGEGLVSTELDLSILEKPQFKNLRSHGDLPVKAGQTGRANPFLPY